MTKRSSAYSRFLLSLLFLPLLSPTSQGQSYSRLEAGAQGVSLLFSDPIDGTQEEAGFGTRISYNFSSILALDTEGDFFPRNAPEGQQRGGRSFTLFAGAKAGWRWKNLGLFLKARPGIINVSNVVQITTGIQPNGTPLLTVFPGGHRTHLALDLGGVAEINTSPRTFVRIDVGEVLIRYDDRVYRIPKTSGFAFVPGVIGKSLSVSAGFSYRLGHMDQTPTSFSRDTLRWEVGGQYELLSMGSAGTIGSPNFDPYTLEDYPGFGGRLTYNFNRWLAMDSALNYFYHHPNVGDAQRGGTILQGCFGPKAGLRTERVGFFVKARPGFLSYGGVHDSAYPPYPTTRVTHFALDLGAVLELYPSRRTMLRFDLGHTLGFFGPRTFLAPVSIAFPNGNLHSAGFRDSGMQFTSGFGWRF